MEWLKKEVRKFLSKKGYAIISGLGSGSYPFPRNTQAGVIKFAIESGLTCGTVIDIGAGTGTESLLNNFNSATFVLIEPNLEFSKKLDDIKQNKKFSTYIFNELLASEEKEIKFFQHDDKFGNTIYEEQETSLNAKFDLRTTKSLDNLVSEIDKDLKTPFFLKLDTQGSEIDILKGGFGVIQKTEAILIETSLHQFFKEGPLFSDVVLYLDKVGFRLIDIADLTYRPIDGKLGQLDCLFVRKSSEMFIEKRYSNR